MKFFLFALSLSLTFPLLALRSGDRSVPLNDVKWLTGKPVRLTFRAPAKGERAYRIVVFLLTHSNNSPETLQILNGLAAHYGSKIQIAVITPDPAFTSIASQCP